MRSEPLVSVVISNHNYARFLDTCIDSVLGQTYRNIEVILVDDGSTDDSRSVLERYAGRVRAIFQPNGGQAAAMSRGVSESTGDFVSLLDSDDGWEPEKVARVVDVLRRYPTVGWVRHKARMVDERLTPLGPEVPSFRGSEITPSDPLLFLERIVNCQPSCLTLRRQTAERVFPLVIEPELRFDADDAVLLARVFATGVTGYSLDEVLGFYRRHLGERFGAHDLPRLMRREADVTAALPRVFGRSAVPTLTYKHRSVLAAMEGARIWSRRRWDPFGRGLLAAARLYRRPTLMLRQSSALFFAYAAPKLWLRKLARSQRWPAVPAGS
jgi:glycosyltransferase involved in cell wall biosynthesis